MTPRGERRRAALLDAAAALLETDGFGAVSHRAVAQRAGLPLAATTYYFASRDELVEHALKRIADAQIRRARAVVDALGSPPATPAAPERVAEVLAAVVTPGGDLGHVRLLCFYERFIQAGRHPHLRPLVRGWNAEVAALVGEALRRLGHPHDPERSRQLLSVLDGLLINRLVEGDEGAVDAVRADIVPLLSGSFLTGPFLTGHPAGGDRPPDER